MANWNRFEGVQEKTFAGLKHALQSVSRNAFVCVWTDAIGDDTSNAVLKNEILTLKQSTQSEIFIMAITGTFEPPAGKKREAPGADDTSKPDRSAIDNQNGEEDGRDRQARVSMPEFENVFRGIGHVMDVMNDPDVIDNIINLMKASALCNIATTTTKTPTTI